MSSFDLDRFLPYRLAVLASAVSGDLSRIYGAEHGISIAEWRVLAHLTQNDRVSVREIHARVMMDKSKVSRSAARLVQAGLVIKAEDAGDKRLVSLSLTAKGRRLMARITPRALDFEAELVAALTPDEAAGLNAAIDRLLALRAARASDGGGDGAPT